MTKHVIVLSIVFTCAGLGACIDEKCDPGFEPLRGACYPVAIDSGPLEAPADAGDAGPDGAAAECPSGEGFGVACQDEAECTCGTHCIPVLEICSLRNCQDTPEVCPADWECRDISAASPDPNVSSICLAKP